MRSAVRISGSCNDALQNDGMLQRIAVVRRLMAGMHAVEATVPSSVSVMNRDGTLRINAIGESKSSRIVCFVSETVRGVRRDMRLALSRKPKDAILVETDGDPYAPLRVLDEFEELAARTEIFPETSEIAYHVPDDAGAALPTRAAAVARAASALVQTVNPNPWEHRRIVVHAPCMGRAGRIVDDRSRNLFSRALTERLLADLDDVVRIQCSNGHYYEAEPVSWSNPLTRMSVEEVMRAVHPIGDVGSQVLSAAAAAD